MVRLFKGTCEAVRAMHTYRPTTTSRSAVPDQSPNPSSSRPPKRQQSRHSDDDERFPQAEDGGDGQGFSYDSVSVPLVTKHQVEEEGDVVFDGDEDLDEPAAENSSGGNQIVPYAHRDLKPGLVLFPFYLSISETNHLFRNVMLADDGTTPILMDFGSTLKARIPVENRSQALLQQVYVASSETLRTYARYRT